MAAHKDDRSIDVLFNQIHDAAQHEEEQNPKLADEIYLIKMYSEWLYIELISYQTAMQDTVEPPKHQLTFIKKYEEDLKFLCVHAINIDAAHNKYPRLKAFAYRVAMLALLLLVTAGILAALPTTTGISIIAMILAWSGLITLVGGSVTTAAGVGAGIVLLFSVALAGIVAICTPPKNTENVTLYSATNDFINKVCAETGIKKAVKPACCCFWGRPTVEIKGPDLSFNPQI